MIAVQSIPALLAAVGTIVALRIGLRSSSDNVKKGLFVLACGLSLGLYAIDFAMFNTALNTAWGFAYMALAFGLLAVLVHLSALVSLERHDAVALAAAIYVYAFVLEELLLFTDWLILEFVPFGWHSYTRAPGPLYFLAELFLIGGVLLMLALPLFGLRNKRQAAARNECKLWVIWVLPCSLLILAIVILLRLKLARFNAPGTAPIPIMLLLAGIAYTIRTKRVVELDFYLPWSRARRHKLAFYKRIERLGTELTQEMSLSSSIDRLATAFRCGVVFVCPSSRLTAEASADRAMATFPEALLVGIRTVVDIESARIKADLYAAMNQHRVAVVVPLTGLASEGWLLLGSTFNHSIYSVSDFQRAHAVFEQLSRAQLRWLEPITTAQVTD